MPRSKILIVEDELILADNIKISLEKHGYDVASLAVSGKEALRTAAEENPDLVLMDIVIKGDLDGINTADQIRKQFGIPVIFLTAYSEDEIFQSAKITEPFAYITKPFDVKQLLINIEMALYKTKIDKEREKLVQDLQNEITERKQAEEALRESEKRYRNLFENAPVSLSAEDYSKMKARLDELLASGIQDIREYLHEHDEEVLNLMRMVEILDINTTALNMYQAKSKEDLVGSLSKITGKEVLKEHIESIISVAEGKPYFEREVNIYNSKGEKLYLLLRWMVRPGYEDTYGRVLVTMLDITERKKGEDALRESEEKYRSLFNNVEIGMFRTRIDGSEMLDMNEKFLENFGFTRDEMQGKPSANFWADPREREVMLRRFKVDDRVTDFECRMINKQGEVRTCITSLRRYRNQEILEGSIIDITERKRMEKILEDGHQELNLIFDSSPIIIFYKNKDGEFLRVNKTFAQAIKLPQEEFAGKTVFDFYSAEIAQDMTKDDREVLKSGHPKLNIIEQYESARGIRWVQTDKIPVYDNTGITVGIVGFSQDITERKKAEEEVKESEEKYRRVIETANEAIFVAQEGMLQLVNDRLVGITGYSREELESRPFLEFIYPDDQEIIAENNRRRLIGETVQSIYTFRFVNKNGAVRWSELSASLFSWEGKPATLNMLSDITERKKAEEALRKNENELENIFNLTPDMICVCTPDGKFVKVSPSCEDVLGYTVDEILKLGWAKLVHPDDVERTKKEVKSQLKGNLVINYINRFRCKDGTYRTLEWRATHVIEDIVYATARDVTERKETEEKLLSYQQNLRSLASELSKTEELERQRIAAYLHDQISQSLAALRINIDELKEIKDYKLISEKAGHIQSILGEILKDSRTLTFDLSPPILHELGFDSAIEWIVEKISKDFNLPIKFENDSHTKPVEKDIGMFLYRSTKECLTNVVKHAKASSIKVNIIREGDYLGIKIEDNGIGFDTSILKSLTHPVGFGLFSMRERIEYIGGELLIWSESGKGTKIIMSVPIKTL